jgi:hypothetical protein
MRQAEHFCRERHERRRSAPAADEFDILASELVVGGELVDCYAQFLGRAHEDGARELLRRKAASRTHERACEPRALGIAGSEVAGRHVAEHVCGAGRRDGNAPPVAQFERDVIVRVVRQRRNGDRAGARKRSRFRERGVAEPRDMRGTRPDVA